MRTGSTGTLGAVVAGRGSCVILARMRRASRAPLTLLLLATPVLLGCGASVASTVRARASIDLSCPADQIGVHDVGGHGYRATGCQHARTYVCTRGLSTLCVADTEVVAAADEPPVASPAAVAWSGGPASGIVRSTWSAVHECAPGTAITLEVEVDGAGEIRPIEIAERVGPREASCISAAAHGASDRAWAGAGRLVLRYELSPPADPTEVLAASASPPQQLSATPPQQVSAVPQAEPAGLRECIGAHAAAILACAPGPVVALSVTWSAAGSLAIDLPGAEGSAAEACVRSVLASERATPAPGSSGSFIHVIERPAP